MTRTRDRIWKPTCLLWWREISLTSHSRTSPKGSMWQLLNSPTPIKLVLGWINWLSTTKWRRGSASREARTDNLQRWSVSWSSKTDTYPSWRIQMIIMYDCWNEFSLFEIQSSLRSNLSYWSTIWIRIFCEVDLRGGRNDKRRVLIRYFLILNSSLSWDEALHFLWIGFIKKIEGNSKNDKAHLRQNKFYIDSETRGAFSRKSWLDVDANRLADNSVEKILGGLLLKS